MLSARLPFRADEWFGDGGMTRQPRRASACTRMGWSAGSVADECGRGIAITPPRPGRTPLAVDSDRPAASAGTLPSGRQHKRRTTRRDQDPDARFSEKRSSEGCCGGRGVDRSVGGAEFDACFHANAIVSCGSRARALSWPSASRTQASPASKAIASWLPLLGRPISVAHTRGRPRCRAHRVSVCRPPAGKLRRGMTAGRAICRRPPKRLPSAGSGRQRPLRSTGLSSSLGACGAHRR